MSDLARPRALLFDWDNTLIDSWAAIHRALGVTLTAMGHQPWTYEQTLQRVRASARDAFPALFGDRAPEAMDLFYKTFEADHLEHLRERAGAGAMLQSLAEADDLYLAVVSNKAGRILRREADHLGWAEFFSRIVGAGDAARDKPAVEAVDLALDGSGLAPGPDVWFVGDTDIDMQCAANAGCRRVLVRPVAPGPGEFGQAEPELHVASCGDFLKVIRAL